MTTTETTPPVINTVESLREHLVAANRVEMSTIPLYLYALYSIQTRSYSQWDPGISAFRAIRAVVIEEMLHLTLSRNLLVAVGGDITYCSDDFVPIYPAPMLNRVPKLPLYLAPCSSALIEDVFLPLEEPARFHAPPEAGPYHTIGQFYAAIEEGFTYLDQHDPNGLWGTAPERKERARRQFEGHAYYNQDGGGSAVVVTSLETALEAITEIVEQGEGARAGVNAVPLNPLDPTAGLDEPSHYERFALVDSNIDRIGTVWPVPDGAKKRIRVARFPKDVRPLGNAFNAAYCYLLAIIDAMYVTPFDEPLEPGQTSRRWGLEQNLLTAMNGLLYPLANLLVSTAISADEHAAPTFEYVDLGPDKKAGLLKAIDAAAATYPSVTGDNSPRSFAVSLLAV